MAGPRKYAVQKPAGGRWETLALVDLPADGHAEFRAAVARHGSGYVRLIQVDFKREDALSDYDWRMIKLHDPFNGRGPAPPAVQPGAKPPLRSPARSAGTRRAEKVPIPVRTYILAFITGALALIVWGVWFRP